MGTGGQEMSENDKIWNEAIDAFADRLSKYYSEQKSSFCALSVAYHVKQIAKDLKRGETDGKN